MVIFPSTNSRCRQLEQFDSPIRQTLDPSSSAPFPLSKGLPTTYPAKWVMAPLSTFYRQVLWETNLLAEVQHPNFWPSQALMNSPWPHSCSYPGQKGSTSPGGPAKDLLWLSAEFLFVYGALPCLAYTSVFARTAGRCAPLLPPVYIHLYASSGPIKCFFSVLLLLFMLIRTSSVTHKKGKSPSTRGGSDSQ